MIEQNCAICTTKTTTTKNLSVHYAPVNSRAREQLKQQVTRSSQIQQQQVDNSPIRQLQNRNNLRNYLQNLHQGHLLIGPQSNLLLFNPSNLSALAAPGSSPSSNGGSQFGLTPDARACVTATYLCVLIVNNTWLDCNLLDMLCNNNTVDQSIISRNRREDELVPLEGTIQLNALESALNELVIFAGGGSSEGGGRDVKSSGSPSVIGEETSESSRSERSGVYLSPVNINNNANQQTAHNGGGANIAQLYTFNNNPLDPPDAQIDEQQVGTMDDETVANKLSRMSDEDRNRLLGQYLENRKSQLDHRTKSKVNSELQISSSNRDETILNQTTNHSDPRDQSSDSITSTTQQSVASIGSSTGALVSWIGRPFRGWGTYSFWSSNQPPADQTIQNLREDYQNNPALINQQQDSAKQQIQYVQILRPIDRSEQYNDIATNQTISSKQLNTNQPRPYNLQVDSMETSMLQNNNNQQQQPSSTAPLFAQVPLLSTSPATFSDLMTAVNSVIASESNPSQTYTTNQLRPPTTPPTSLMGLYDFAPNSPGRQLQASEMHHQLIQQQQQQQQQHLQQFQPQPDEPSVDCNCNELGMSDEQLSTSVTSGSPLADCRYRCTSQVSTTPPMGDPNQLVTSFTTTSSTTITPSGKMNPLDVTFLLYTRYHRDVANSMNVQMSNAPSSLAISSSIALPSTQSTNLMNAGELIELINETTLSEFRLNSSLPIKIVIHGFGSGGRRPWVADMVSKLLDYEDVNVIVVDWEKGATLPNYVQAAGNTRLVGHKLASLIKSINTKFGLTGNSYHLIGFSLGAHVAGFAGMEIRNSTSVSRLWINRITGLDPASPLFEGYEANDRLDPSDAQFVDVIHSNGDGVLRGGFGSLQPMGHVDFYPNGGRVQVGCNSVLLSALSDIIYGKWQSLCNHRRALNFFMDSFEFSKCRFRSFNCDSYENYLKGECFDCGFNNERCSYMGYLANYSKGRGKMYLTTHEEAPFCANQFIIKIVGTKGHKTHWGKVEVTLITLDGKNESFWLSSMSHQSNGHELTGSPKVLSQHSMQSLIVAHPMLVNFTQVLLRYTKYKGWIYSGDESWSIDKVFITDSDGQVKSFCGFNTILESHITTRLSLEPGNCTVAEPVGSVSQLPQGQQLSRTLGQQVNSVTNGVTPSGGVTTSLVQQQQLSSRTPRLFANMMSSQQEPQTTPILPQGHSFQRMSSDRQQQQPFNLNYNIPYVAAF